MNTQLSKAHRHPLWIMLLCAAFLAFSHSTAYARKEMNWIYFNFPPMFIENGDKVEGSGIQTINMLWADMLGYEHKLLKSSPAQTMKRMQAGEHIVALGMLRTNEREKIMAFNEFPCRLVSASMVALRAEDVSKLAPAGVVSVRSLLQNPKLTFATIPSMSYGKLNPILKKYQNENRTINADRGGEQLVSMLVHGKADWIIVDPLAITYFYDKVGVSDKIVLARIKENPVGFLPGYIAAPRTEWGKKVLKEIDSAMRTIIQTNALYRRIAPTVPKELKGAFASYYDQLIRQPALEPIPIN